MSYIQTVLDDNPVSYWRLGETTGTIAQDEQSIAPASYEQTYTLGATGALVGDNNTALSLSGAGAVMIPHVAALNIAVKPLSVEAWFKTNSISQYQLIYHAMDISFTNGISIDVWEGNVIEVVSGSNGMQLNAVVNDGVWHHCVIVVTANNRGLIYLDGVLRIESAGFNSEPGSYVGNRFIGGDIASNDGYFSGQLDEIAVYNTELAADRVAIHYAVGMGAQSTQTNRVVRVNGWNPSEIHAMSSGAGGLVSNHKGFSLTTRSGSGLIRKEGRIRTS